MSLFGSRNRDEWSEIFARLAQLGLSQNLIADYLQIDKATLSRLRRDPGRFDQFMATYPHRGRLDKLVRAARDELVAKQVLIEALRARKLEAAPLSDPKLSGIWSADEFSFAHGSGPGHKAKRRRKPWGSRPLR